MEIKCSKGDRIILMDKLNQKFEGIVKSVNTDSGNLLLKQVVLRPDNQVIEGYMHFHKKEIVLLKICEKNMTNADIDEMNSPESPFPAYDEVEQLNKTYQYISKFDSNFFTALNLIKNSSKIGLYMVDVSKGRLERGSLLAISTQLQVFVFDIQILGDDSFTKGLKEILESPKLTKIVHDCRLLSDCLKHKYLVNLENVRDVEAEDIMVVFQERRMIRKHSRSLDYLVKVYLNIKLDVKNSWSDEWNKRPLALKLLEYAVQLVSYLLPLHEVIESKFLQRLINASLLYNNFVRNSDVYESVHCNPNTTLRQQLINLVKKKDKPRTSFKNLKIS